VESWTQRSRWKRVPRKCFGALGLGREVDRTHLCREAIADARNRLDEFIRISLLTKRFAQL
jgi:hypothetical protein